MEIEIRMPIFLFQFFDSKKEYLFNFWFVIFAFKNFKPGTNKDRKAMKTNYSEFEGAICAIMKVSINAFSTPPIS